MRRDKGDGGGVERWRCLAARGAKAEGCGDLGAGGEDGVVEPEPLLAADGLPVAQLACGVVIRRARQAGGRRQAAAQRGAAAGRKG